MMLHVLHERDFKTLFVEKYKQLYYFAFDYLKDGDECRDIVSEVFAAVWNRHSKIDRKKIDSYLYSSVRNKRTISVKCQRNILCSSVK